MDLPPLYQSVSGEELPSYKKEDKCFRIEFEAYYNFNLNKQTLSVIDKQSNKTKYNLQIFSRGISLVDLNKKKLIDMFEIPVHNNIYSFTVYGLNYMFINMIEYLEDKVLRYKAVINNHGPYPTEKTYVIKRTKSMNKVLISFHLFNEIEPSFSLAKFVLCNSNKSLAELVFYSSFEPIELQILLLIITKISLKHY